MNTPGLQTRRGTILLVDDSADDRDLTVRAFQRLKVRNDIVAVGDGQEALDYLFGTGAYVREEPIAMPGLVLLDINLPRVTGIEVLARMRADERTRRVPVVMLTSSREESDVRASYDRGANSFVRKTVDFAAFVASARELCSYWLVLNEPAP